SYSLGYLECALARTNHVRHVLLTAIASCPVRASNDIANDVPDITNCVAAHKVASSVVDLFKEVNIHHKRADLRRFGALGGIDDFEIQFGEKAATRAEPGEFVALGHLVKLLLKLRLVL